MVYGYVRVSTDLQESENQKIGITSFAEKKEMSVDKWISDDGVSGSVDYKDRKLGKMMRKLKRGDKIIISELSRLSRNLYMTFEILKHFSENEIEMYSVKDGYCLDGSIQSKVLAFGLGLAAEIEKYLLSKRTKEGLEARRRAGVVLGRPIGTGNANLKLDKKENEVKEYLQNGLGYAAIARMTNTSRGTVKKFCEDRDLEQYKTISLFPVDHNHNMEIFGKKSQYCDVIKIDNDEVLKYYRSNGYSLRNLAKQLNIASHASLRTFLEYRGLWDIIVNIAGVQRVEVKSNRQIERETGVPARKK